MLTIAGFITDPAELPRHQPSRESLSREMGGVVVKLPWSSDFIKNFKMQFQTCDQQIEDLSIGEAQRILRANRERLSGEGFPFGSEADLRSI